MIAEKTILAIYILLGDGCISVFINRGLSFFVSALDENKECF